MCNISCIVAFLTYLVRTNLERFVASNCREDMVLDPIMKDIELKVTFMVNVLSAMFIIIFLVTLVYSFIDTHNINNINSGYVYPHIDLASSYQ